MNKVNLSTKKKKIVPRLGSLELDLSTNQIYLSCFNIHNIKVNLTNKIVNAIEGDLSNLH